MKVVKSIRQISHSCRQLSKKGQTLGFVPTMGALHEGHLSLIRQARKENTQVIVSIFVNPLQFGPKEDFQKYPRNFRRDSYLCQKQGVDILFYPQVKEMYPAGYRTSVRVADLEKNLCGRFRPGHFPGVATVVAKLFNLVQPDRAYFGQKDAQQARIIQKMAEDLNLPLKIKIMPTLREKDGLAMSSRNVYLNPKERKAATVLYQALKLAQKLIKQGRRNSREIIRKMRWLINTRKSARVQYIEIVDLKELRPVKKIKNKVLIALAVFIGKTRLIDNLIVNLGQRSKVKSQKFKTKFKRNG